MGESSTGSLAGRASSIEYEAENEEIDTKSRENNDLITNDKVSIQNYTNFKINIDELMKEDLKFNFDKKGPKVLIYHTHTTESYLRKTADIGKKGISAYTSDQRYNVVRVGDELSKNLKKYGINVLHNGTVHDTKFNSSYAASLKTMQEYIKSYPSIKIMFDLHRDGLDDTNKLRLVTKVNGKNAAQVMIVVGTNGTGLPHPKWKENLKFALRLQEVMNEKYPGLARPVWISKNRYNQQLTTGNLLIEIGGDGNVLSECLESTKYVAEAVNEVINGK
jgi:stage II sporulation protein P